MFFDEDFMNSRRFKNVWRAAHNLEADANDVDIPKVCNSISKLMDDYSDNKLRHLSLRTAYTLVLGTVKTYKEQVDQLSKDAFNLALEMEFGISNVGANGKTSYPAVDSSNEANEEHSNPGDKETSINIGDLDDSNTSSDSEEHFDPGEKETSSSIGDSDDNEDEMNANTRAEARSSAETSISNATRQLSPVFGLSRTTIINQTANDIRSPKKSLSDDQVFQGEGSSNMAVITRVTNQEVQTNKSFIKKQKLKQLYRRGDPVFDKDLPLARTTIYAAGSRRPVKIIWSTVNPDVMKL